MLKNSREDLITRKNKLGNVGSLEFLISYLEAKDKGINPLNHQTLLADIDFRFDDLNVVEKLRRFKSKRENGTAIEKDLFLKAAEIQMAEGNLKPERISSLFEDDLLIYPEAHLLVANSCLDGGDELGWLSSVNSYLESQDISLLSLKGDVKEPLFYRISATPRRYITQGPKVSVIIPAYNAEKTIEHSVGSILQQSWKNIEVIVVDDCSTDNTWSVLKKLSKTDSRLIVRRNSRNSGPYIAKNLALEIATGDFITGHDADDWSHPERIDKQLAYIKKYNCPISLSYMVRLQEDGRFSYLGKRTTFSPDGALRKALISTMFDRRYFEEVLGSWDCVRFGADSELFERAQLALGTKRIPEAPFVSMLCLDLDTNLTNHPTFGIDKKTGVKGPRVEYKDAWKKWHKTLKSNNVKLELGVGRKSFKVPLEAYAEFEGVVLVSD